MKELVAAVTQRDAGALRRMAATPRQATAPVPDATVRIFNDLFRQLCAAFPATSAQFKTQADFNELRRQWLMAFAENDINTMEQVERGMRVARQQATPFLPSPGQFIAWCDAGTDTRLPDADTLYGMVMTYSATRFDHENYPWPDNACYWMVTRLFDQMRHENLTERELRQRCHDELKRMSQQLASGNLPPEPVRLLSHTHTPVSQERGREYLANIRAMLKGNRK
ncbi:DNA replication protein [Salmonella enterica]